MKNVMIVVLGMVILLALSVPGLALDLREELTKNLPFTVGDLEISGGITYNTFAMTGMSNGEEFTASEDEKGLKSGLGYGLNLNYWFNKWLGLGVNLDNAKSSISFEDEFFGKVTETGRLKGIAFGLNTRFFNEMVKANVAFANYDYTLGFSFNDSLLELTHDFAGFGILVGTGINIPVLKAFSVTASLDYRLASVSPIIEGEMVEDTQNNYLNLSGLRVGCGVSYIF